MRSIFAIVGICVCALLVVVLFGFGGRITNEGEAIAQYQDAPATGFAPPSIQEQAPAVRFPPSDDYAAPTYSSGSSGGYSSGVMPGPQYQPAPVPSSQPVVVEIKNGPSLVGELVDLNAFQFRAVFGQISIPVASISGIRIAEDPRQPATVCFWNGDSITGTLVNESVAIKTPWGGATVRREHLVSIVTTTDPVSWQQENERWELLRHAVEEEELLFDSADPGYEAAPDLPADEGPFAPAAEDPGYGTAPESVEEGAFAPAAEDPGFGPVPESVDEGPFVPIPDLPSPQDEADKAGSDLQPLNRT